MVLLMSCVWFDVVVLIVCFVVCECYVFVFRGGCVDCVFFVVVVLCVVSFVCVAC